MAKKKRHAAGEIAAKLLEADVLAERGETQAAIAKALGVSVMTLHRWRKEREAEAPSPHAKFLEQPATLPTSNSDPSSRIAALQHENGQLRKLITDLLLEKVRLEDEQQRLRVRR